MRTGEPLPSGVLHGVERLRCLARFSRAVDGQWWPVDILAERFRGAGHALQRAQHQARVERCSRGRLQVLMNRALAPGHRRE